MKDMIIEIKKAAEYRKVWAEIALLVYLVNKRHYDFELDYYEGKEVVYIDKGDDFVGILHAKFPIGFILETAYDDFKDLKFYHLVKVTSLDKPEWSVDLQEMKAIAPEINWLSDDAVENSKEFSIMDFVFATN